MLKLLKGIIMNISKRSRETNFGITEASMIKIQLCFMLC